MRTVTAYFTRDGEHDQYVAEETSFLGYKTYKLIRKAGMGDYNIPYQSDPDNTLWIVRNMFFFMIILLIIAFVGDIHVT